MLIRFIGLKLHEHKLIQHVVDKSLTRISHNQIANIVYLNAFTIPNFDNRSFVLNCFLDYKDSAAVFFRRYLNPSSTFY